jgi:tripartite ATP-independent transporter DctP family solute receptor
MPDIAKLALCAALALALSSAQALSAQDAAGEQAPEADAPAAITLRAAQILHPGHPISRGLEYMALLVKERSGGRLSLDIQPASRFSGERELIERVQMGDLDLIVITTAPLYGFTSDFLVFDLPYLFDDAQTARRVLDGPFGEKTLQKAIAVGLVGLAYYENGMRHVTSAGKPVSVPGDLKGLKIRTLESRIHMDVFRTLGATPVPLAFGDLYQNLKSGSIDGQENPLSVIATSKLYEVQKNLALTGHFYMPSPMFIAASVWNKLPEDQRQLLRQASRDAMHYHRAVSDGFDGEETLNLLKSRMAVNEHPDRSLWKKAVAPVRGRFRAEIGEEALAELDSEIARVAGGGPAPPSQAGSRAVAVAKDGPEAADGARVGTEAVAVTQDGTQAASVAQDGAQAASATQDGTQAASVTRDGTQAASGRP